MKQNQMHINIGALFPYSLKALRTNNFIVQLAGQGFQKEFLNGIKFVKSDFWVESYKFVTDFSSGQKDPTQSSYIESTINMRDI